MREEFRRCDQCKGCMHRRSECATHLSAEYAKQPCPYYKADVNTCFACSKRKTCDMRAARKRGEVCTSFKAEFKDAKGAYGFMTQPKPTAKQWKEISRICRTKGIRKPHVNKMNAASRWIANHR